VYLNVAAREQFRTVGLPEFRLHMDGTQSETDTVPLSIREGSSTELRRACRNYLGGLVSITWMSDLMERNTVNETALREYREDRDRRSPRIRLDRFEAGFRK
jgi:hypothetical protein